MRPILADFAVNTDERSSEPDGPVMRALNPLHGISAPRAAEGRDRC